MCQMFHDLKELASTCFPGESSWAKWSKIWILRTLSLSWIFFFLHILWIIPLSVVWTIS
jgi:hypothetical protein